MSRDICTRVAKVSGLSASGAADQAWLRPSISPAGVTASTISVAPAALSNERRETWWSIPALPMVSSFRGRPDRLVLDVAAVALQDLDLVPVRVLHKEEFGHQLAV